jgi:hypothetical protein
VTGKYLTPWPLGPWTSKHNSIATADPSFWWCRDVRKVVHVPREWPFAPREGATYLEKLASEVMEHETLLWRDLHANAR